MNDHSESFYRRRSVCHPHEAQCCHSTTLYTLRNQSRSTRRPSLPGRIFPSLHSEVLPRSTSKLRLPGIAPPHTTRLHRVFTWSIDLRSLIKRRSHRAGHAPEPSHGSSYSIEAWTRSLMVVSDFVSEFGPSPEGGGGGNRSTLCVARRAISQIPFRARRDRLVKARLITTHLLISMCHT